MSDRATTYAALRKLVLAEVERQRPGTDGWLVTDGMSPGLDGDVHLLLATGLADGRYSYMQFKAAVGADTNVMATEATAGVREWLQHIDSETQEAAA